MQIDIQQRVKQIKQIYLDFLTPSNRLSIKKLMGATKQSTKVSMEQQPTEESYYTSLEQQVSALEREIKSSIKFQMSDYQAFRWTIKKEGSEIRLPECVKILKIPQNLKRLSSLNHPTNLINFKSLNYSVEQLCKMTSSLLEEKGKCRELMKEKDLNRLVRVIAEEYNINGYHNFTHAFSVLMIFRHIGNTLKLWRYYSQLELFVAEIAALAHDLGHKGLNSQWEIKKKSALAHIYEGESVLQKMHVARFFRLLKQHPELDFFHSIKDATSREYCRKLFVSLILSTDMGNHFRAVEQFQKIYKESPQSLTSSCKLQTLEMIFHSADIGNPCMEFDQYMNWSVLLACEFNNQALKEEKCGFEVSHGFKYVNTQQFYEGQIGFIETFCLPIWKNICLVFPEASYYQERVIGNRDKVQHKLTSLCNKTDRAQK